MRPFQGQLTNGIWRDRLAIPKQALRLSLLEQGMIQPKTDTKRAGKNHKAIKQAIVELREANADGGDAVELQSLIEQACNFCLQNGCFPETYEEMQPVPVPSILPAWAHL